MDSDLDFMQLALEEGAAAALAGEVPVGAVLVRDGEVVRASRQSHDSGLRSYCARGNRRAARGGARKSATTGWPGRRLYVTIEPCSMCAGAIIQARVPRVVYGCDDPKGGAVRSCFEVLTHPRLNHQVEVTSGRACNECAALIQSFFAERRYSAYARVWDSRRWHI